MVIMLLFFFFFQAEDGIRDVAVTGVQTCALPISRPLERHRYSYTEDKSGCKAMGRNLIQRISIHPDRKSTRLNSSHGYISYAVFCLKKKKKDKKNRNYN